MFAAPTMQVVAAVLRHAVLTIRVVGPRCYLRCVCVAVHRVADPVVRA